MHQDLTVNYNQEKKRRKGKNKQVGQKDLTEVFCVAEMCLKRNKHMQPSFSGAFDLAASSLLSGDTLFSIEVLDSHHRAHTLCCAAQLTLLVIQQARSPF